MTVDTSLHRIPVLVRTQRFHLANATSLWMWSTMQNSVTRDRSTQEYSTSSGCSSFYNTGNVSDSNLRHAVNRTSSNGTDNCDNWWREQCIVCSMLPRVCVAMSACCTKYTLADMSVDEEAGESTGMSRRMATRVYSYSNANPAGRASAHALYDCISCRLLIPLYVLLILLTTYFLWISFYTSTNMRVAIANFMLLLRLVTIFGHFFCFFEIVHTFCYLVRFY